MSDLVRSIDSQGRWRTYPVHLPPGKQDAGRPLLIALHGRRSSGAEMKSITHFDRAADRHGFLEVYPEGHQHSWNDGRGNAPGALDGIDDVGFIRNVIDRTIEEFGAARDQVGVAGLSNGAVMCQRLGLELSDRIAAIGAVAGLMPVRIASLTPTHAVSVLLIHGTADAYVPIGGGAPNRFLARRILGRLRGSGRAGPSLSLVDTLARWRAIDQCTTGSTQELIPASRGDPTSVRRSSSGGGRGGTAVDCWVVNLGGHTWPGGPPLVLLGRTSSRFDASEVILQFALTHSQPAARRLLGPPSRA